MNIIFTRRFSMAHRLRYGVSMKCEMPHGHNEFVSAHLRYIGEASLDSNVVVDFSDLKRDWHNWIDNSVDHALQLGEDDPLISYFIQHEPDLLPHLMITPGDPSTELLAAIFFSKLDAFVLAAGLPFSPEKMVVEETPTNSVTIKRDDLDLFPALARKGWWSCADKRINDLEASAVALTEVLRTSH